MLFAYVGVLHCRGVIERRLMDANRSSESLFPAFEHTTQVLHCLNHPLHATNGLFVIFCQHVIPLINYPHD